MGFLHLVYPHCVCACPPIFQSKSSFACTNGFLEVKPFIWTTTVEDFLLEDRRYRLSFGRLSLQTFIWKTVVTDFPCFTKQIFGSFQSNVYASKRGRESENVFVPSRLHPDAIAGRVAVVDRDAAYCDVVECRDQLCDEQQKKLEYSITVVGENVLTSTGKN